MGDFGGASGDLGSLKEDLEATLGGSWGDLRAFWRYLGGSWGDLLGILGGLGGIFWGSWGDLG